ncbi:MAG: transglutaminase domain-containing protein [Lachnospiraceae bacterium]|nr:transglutaminase domain-containing protein [Lachnospiraceae bacterium]
MKIFFYELLYVSAVSLGAATLLFPLLGAGELFWLVVTVIVLLSGILTGFKNAGWTVRMLLTAGAVTVVSAILLLNRNEAIHEVFVGHAALLWLPVIAVFTFLAGEGVARIRLFRILVAAGSGLSLIPCAALSIRVEKLFVVAVLSLLLLTAAEEIQRTWKKSGSTDGVAHLVTLAPFLLVTMLLVAIAPVSEKPYDWAFVKKIAAQAEKGMRELHIRLSIGNDRDPSESMMGFSGRGQIFGRLHDSEEEIMVLSGLTPGIRYEKLTGKTFDTFDGQEWTDTDSSGLRDVTLDTISLLASAEEFTDHREDLIHRATMQIRYRKINTAYVFHPLKTIAAGSWAAAARLQEGGGDLLWPGVKSFRTEYTVPYFRINRDHDLFLEYLRGSKLPSYSSFAPNAMMVAGQDAADYSYEDLLRHREHVYEVYARPVELSGELRADLDALCAGVSAPCDRMVLLEGMLRGLSYTDQPGKLPERVKGETEFLDYFLKESREGYCSHFATALVLLARAEGLPARYVQGYLVPVGGETEVVVRAAMAHAWAEVYYDGAGWIPYEPTPIYEVMSRWETVEEREKLTEAAVVSPVGPPEHETVEAPDPEPEEEETHHIRIPWYAVAIPVAAGLLFAVFLLTILKLIRRIRFGRLTERERFAALCRRNLMLLRLLNLGIGETETLREYGSRIAAAAGAENVAFLRFLEDHLYDGSYDPREGESVATETGQRLAERLQKEHPLRSLRARMQTGM